MIRGSKYIISKMMVYIAEEENEREEEKDGCD